MVFKAAVVKLYHLRSRVRFVVKFCFMWSVPHRQRASVNRKGEQALKVVSREKVNLEEHYELLSQACCVYASKFRMSKCKLQNNTAPTSVTCQAYVYCDPTCSIQDDKLQTYGANNCPARPALATTQQVLPGRVRSAIMRFDYWFAEQNMADGCFFSEPRSEHSPAACFRLDYSMS